MTGVIENQTVTVDNETQNKEKKVESKNKYVITVPIKKPIEIDDGSEKVSINSITLDFSNITGADILKIDEQLRLEGSFFDHLYNQKVLIKLASFGANMKVEDLLRLHGADLLEVTISTRNFFIQW